MTGQNNPEEAGLVPGSSGSAVAAGCFARPGNRSFADEEWKKLGEVNVAESRITPTMILAPNPP